MTAVAGRNGNRASANGVHDADPGQRLLSLLTAAAKALGESPSRGEGPDLADPAATRRTVTVVVDRLTAELDRPSSELRRSELLHRARLALDLERAQHELEAQKLGRGINALEGVQSALSRLRGEHSPTEMIERGASVLCEACNFDRAIFFRIHDACVVPQHAYFSKDPDWAEEFISVAGTQPVPLSMHEYHEAEMFRRRTPLLVRDPQNDPAAYKPIVTAIKTPSYVAAPIMPAGKVIGLLHADAYYAGRAMTPLDRDTLWAFAEGFGYALQRTLLIERLRAQRDQVRQMVTSTEAVVSELTDAELELLQTDGEGAALARTAAAVFVAPESRLEALMTPRELEVLELVAHGDTNGAIADQLVISEGTVKSHVKHILRKLNAANRAEAVSRYMRLRPTA